MPTKTFFFECYNCGKKLPIVVEQDPEQPEVRTVRPVCPYCDHENAVDVPGKLIPNDTIVRGTQAPNNP